MRKFNILVLILIITAILSSGCSSAFDSITNAASVAERNEGAGNVMSEYAGMDYYMDMEEMDAESSYEYGSIQNFSLTAGAESGGSSAEAIIPSEANLPEGRKIIRDANITLEVGDAEKSYANILENLARFGGYEANREMQSYTYDDYYYGRSSGRYHSPPTVSATLKIPAANLDAFIAGLKGEGEVISSNISSADITEQYFDAEIKLTTLEKTLENYYRFLEEARDIDEQLRITRYINDITREIEQLKGSLRRWDSLVDYSTVTLYLYRPYEAPIPEPEPRVIEWNSLSAEDMGWFISRGFLSVVNAIFSVIQWVIIAVATASPAVVPIAVIVWLIIRKYRKNNKNKKKQANIPEAKTEL